MEYVLYSQAKINLFLHLIGRNEKNYYLIQSVMHFTDLSDKIYIKKSDELKVKFGFNNDIIFPQIDEKNNSIVRIIQTFCKKFDLNENFSIFVEKNIPSGGGLGGGSANGATILKFLQKYYNLEISQKEQSELALTIGCDAVACLHNQPILVEGEGEIISKYSFDNKIYNSYVLLIYPQIFSSSEKAYTSFKENHYEFSEEIKFDNDIKIDLNFLKKCRNDLMQCAIKFFPQIGELLDFLNSKSDSEDCLVRMSGSGSSCFVLSENRNFLTQIEKELKVLNREYFSRICKFV